MQHPLQTAQVQSYPDPSLLPNLNNLSPMLRKELIALLLNRCNPFSKIDELALDVKDGARLIKELDQKLKQVELEVMYAFKDLDGE